MQMTAAQRQVLSRFLYALDDVNELTDDPIDLKLSNNDNADLLLWRRTDKAITSLVLSPDGHISLFITYRQEEESDSLIHYEVDPDYESIAYQFLAK